ncbi:HET-domain-containing protein, partial [Bimuria novae-zelandiae CBS 107.79]
MPKNEGAIYQPLHPDGGIRILILEPGSKDSQICCRLTHTNINDEPEYKALSYEWGPVDDQKLITINGEEVSVRQNLWSALWHLRQDLGDHCAQHSFLLWIDALCINQDDKIECGNQVSMMGSIYRNADVI